MRTTLQSRINLLSSIIIIGAVCLPLTGCIAFGYSSGGGWFIWPGGLGLLLLIAIVLMVLRRR